MRTVVVTGSASGIGAALGARLQATGHRVIGVDLHDADVEADLATEAGRAAMVDEVAQRCGGVLDGVVAGAGVANGIGEHVCAVNWLGARDTLAALRPLLARGDRPSAVAISSNSTTTAPALPGLVDACLAGDDAATLALAATDPTGMLVYPATKLALARWVRHQATTDPWIGAGIRLNAVAPGFIDTPMTDGGWDFVASLGDTWPIPIDRPGRPDEIAALLEFLLSPDAGFFVGSVVFADGGTDARLNPERV